MCLVAGEDFITYSHNLAFKLQVRAWTANPNQFVEDEDEATFAYSVRISAQDLLLVSVFALRYIYYFH